MTGKFDPYHVWLGIPPEEQPPDLYRLLGVPRFEETADVIATAADRQAAYLRTLRGGQQGALAEKLIKEIAKAKGCLLNREKKSQYDQLLRKVLAKKEAACGKSPPVAGAADVEVTSVYERKPAARESDGGAAAEGGVATAVRLGKIGDYELIEHLGEGGMGTVYKAFHTNLGREVALKVLHKNFLSDDRAIARFKREMKAAGKLSHPNIVRADDAGESEGTWYLAMELLDGMDLSALVRHEGPLKIADAAEVIRQAALGLQHAHEHEQVHRDIKPSNLMLTAAGQVKILDMGLAKVSEEDEPEKTAKEELTKTGQMMGTPDYMAPEQCNDSHRVDIRADVYALGATFYKLLTGHAPFSGERYDTPGKKFIAVCTEDPEPIQQHRSDIPKVLVSAVHRMMAKDPDARFRSPARVADAVGPFTSEADLTNLLARAQNKSPVKKPSHAMEPTAASATSGLTRFFQRVKKPEPRPAVPAEASGGGTSWAKVALLVGGPVLFFLCVAAIIVWAVFREPTPPPLAKTGLVFDWPIDERRTVKLSIDSDRVEFPEAGPLVYDCEPGKHEVVARRPGFKPYKQTFEIGEEEQLNVPPVWLPQTYLVLELPSKMRKEVRLEVDGSLPDVPTGELETTAERIKFPIAAGRHTVRIERRGFEPFEQVLEITEGEVGRVEPRWEPLTTSPEIASTEGIDEPVPDHPPDPESQKLAVPPDDAQQAITPTIEDTYRIADAKTVDRKAALARELLEAVKVREDPVEKYVLYSRAIDLAVDSADATLAAEAVDALATEFDVDSSERKQVALVKIEQIKQAEEASAKAREEAERLAEAARQRQIRYRKALEPVEMEVASWNFQGAAAALQQVALNDDPKLAAQLEQRRDEVRRMAVLKEKIITKVNAAKGRLSKKDLFLKGLSGDVLGADEQGIHAKLSSGRTELLPWGELNDKARSRLLEVAIDRSRADDWISAGVLALSSGDVELAERLLSQAHRQAGDVGPYLAPLAEAALVQANGLVEKKQYEEAVEALDALEKKYGKTPWFATNKDVVAATRAGIDRAQYEEASEKLYAQSKELFEAKELFDLKDILAKLEANFPESAAMTETTREPSIEEMKKAVADLGQRLIVRLDGKGDFSSIQAAINASEPGCLIEIQDNGPYNEQIEIPREKQMLTIQGQKGRWPVVTSFGKKRDFETLVVVAARGTNMRRLCLVHGTPSGKEPHCIEVLGNTPGVLRLSSAIVFMEAGASGIAVQRNYGEAVLENCLVLARVDQAAGRRSTFSNCLLLHKEGNHFANAEIRGCTISGGSDFERPSVLVDCILKSMRSSSSDHRIDNCLLFDSKPFQGEVKAGRNCLNAIPLFVNPMNLDFRPAENSPCIGKASDGGDIGCRYTPEIFEMCKIANELRARGVIKF